MLTYYDEEITGSEPLNVHPLAVVEVQEVPYSVSSYWIVESIKSFYHAVGMAFEGF